MLAGVDFPAALGFGFATGLMGVGFWVAGRRPDWPVTAPRTCLMVLAGASLLALAGFVQWVPPGLTIRIDASTEPLLPLGDPGRAVYREAVRDFGDDEIYSVAVVCGEVFAPPCLDAVHRATGRMARLDGVRSVSSLTDVTAFGWVEEEEWIEIAPFIEEVPRDPAVLRGLRARALEDPVYRQTLVSADARATAINIRFRKMDDAAFIDSGLDEAVVAILAEEMPSDVPFHVAGRPHVKVHVYRGILRDLLLLVPLAVVVMGCVLIVFFRSLRGVALPLGTALVANVWTFGAIGWLGESLSLLTGLLAPMLVAIGSVYGVHVMARYQEEALTATSSVAAAAKTLDHVRRPGLIAGITTVIGFGALLWTDVPAVFELGVFAMWGVASATVVSLLGIPSVLALLPLPDRPAAEPAPMRWVEAVLAGLATRVARHRRGIVWGFGGVALIAALAIPRIDVDTDYLSYFSPADPIRVDFEAVNAWLAGVVPIYVVVDGGEAGRLRDPVLLRRIERLEERLEALAPVSRTVSVLDTLRQANRAFHADDPGAAEIPGERGAVTELLFMLPKSEATRLLTVDHARANVVVRTGVVGSSAVLDLAAALEAEVAAAPLDAHDVIVTGNTILLSRSADGITRGQPLSVLAAALAIALLITRFLGSARLGAIAMIPNLVPVLFFFGLLGLGAASLSLPTSLIGCMALGVAIDDTAHWLARYRAERAQGARVESAIAMTTRRVGRPIAVTSLMLCAGFLVVTASRFATLQAFGVLSAFTMAVCLVTDLVLLPAVLMRTSGTRSAA